LAQHHLKDGRTCRPLIDFLGLGRGDRVLEIGPGGGILTRELLATGASVLAVELDAVWAFELRKSGWVGDSGEGLSIVVADALELAWEKLPGGCRVAGNLPYNVGTAIVERLLRAARPGTRAAFLLQREVVDRLVAGPGDDAYGALSVLVALRARASRLGVVKAGAFVPPPKVDSAFVGLETVAPPLAAPELAHLERVIAAAFAQRRKTVANSLGAAFGRERVVRALAGAGIAPRRRAEELAHDELARLAAELGAPDSVST
jgi:16S rRNA (adenine1518-N6/adenine1519-N6)-dimethyltransferase